MKNFDIRQSVLSAALVVAVSFSAWYGFKQQTESVLVPAPAAPEPIAESKAPTDLAAQMIEEEMPSEEAFVDETVPSNFGGAAKAVFARLANVKGAPIDLKSDAFSKSLMTGEKVRGRSADLDASTLDSLNEVNEGDVVSIPTFDGELRGVVEVAVVEEDGRRRVGGPIEGDRSKGWFSFGYDGSRATGLVQVPAKKLAYNIEGVAGGQHQLVERPLRDFVCMSLPTFKALQTAAVRGRANAAAGGAIQTVIQNSRPAATAQIYIDFDGENVNDPDWGRINAPASPLTTAQRSDVFRRVKEDFLQFNINVTTDVAKYNAAKPGDRMRCIVTTVDTAAPGAGGVAFLNSFAYAGSVFSANVPCWCFNPTVKSIADTVSHEVGHTLALRHDGLVGRAEYYLGHGTGTVSWGPIMGAPFTRSLGQWSRGEYAAANNYEYDIEIIANSVNGFGYAPDDVGDTPATAARLSFTGSTIEQRGVIDKLFDRDVFSFNTARGGSVLVAVGGIGNQVGNLDVRVDVLNKNGVLLGTNTFDRSIQAGLNVVVGPGTNYIRIRAAGDGDVNTTGYPAYGSSGSYTITGRLP